MNEDCVTPVLELRGMEWNRVQLEAAPCQCHFLTNSGAITELIAIFYMGDLIHCVLLQV